MSCRCETSTFRGHSFPIIDKVATNNTWKCCKGKHTRIISGQDILDEEVRKEEKNSGVLDEGRYGGGAGQDVAERSSRG